MNEYAHAKEEERESNEQGEITNRSRREKMGEEIRKEVEQLVKEMEGRERER